MATNELIESNARSTLFAKIFGADSVDCRFQFVDEATNEVKEIAAHQKVMSGNSPALAAMFNGNWNENTNAVIIKDSSFEAFDAFIKYFYQDKFEMTAQNVVDLLTLADKYDVQDLVKHCESYISRKLTSDNVLKYFPIAERFRRSELKIECVRLFIKPTDILQSESFSACDISTLAKFLRVIARRCDAAKVFDACIGWAKRRCEENEKDATCMANLRTELGECFELILFKQMRFEAMAERFKTYKMLFTPGESIDILEHLLDNTRAQYDLYPKIKFRGMCELSGGSVPDVMSFQLSKSALLNGITPAKAHVNGTAVDFSAKITVKKGSQVIFTETADSTIKNRSFTFSQKVHIDAGKVYQITINRKLTSYTVLGYTFKRRQLGDVEFIPIQGRSKEVAEEARWSGEEIRFD